MLRFKIKLMKEGFGDDLMVQMLLSKIWEFKRVTKFYIKTPKQSLGVIQLQSIIN